MKKKTKLLLGLGILSATLALVPTIVLLSSCSVSTSINMNLLITQASCFTKTKPKKVLDTKVIDITPTKITLQSKDATYNSFKIKLCDKYFKELLYNNLSSDYYAPSITEVESMTPEHQNQLCTIIYEFKNNTIPTGFTYDSNTSQITSPAIVSNTTIDLVGKIQAKNQKTFSFEFSIELTVQ